MEIHRIDKDEIESKFKEPPYLYNHSDVARIILTKLYRTRNEITLKTGKFHNKLVISEEILEYIDNLADFHINPVNKLKPSYEVELEGNIGGIAIYRDYTFTLKNFEYMFFINDNDKPFTKQWFRRKKLERILK